MVQLSFAEISYFFLFLMYRCFKRNVFFKNLIMNRKKKQLYKMLCMSGKPILGHLCFKYLKIINAKNYALKTGFSKGLILEVFPNI